MARQKRIPGVEVSEFPEVLARAEDYLEAKEKLDKAKGYEDAARVELLGSMKRAGIEDYHSDKIDVKIIETEKVKVKRIGAKDSAEVPAEAETAVQ